MTDLFQSSDPVLARARAARMPDEILARAVEACDHLFGVPPVVIALFSGGTDSMLAAEVAARHPRFLCAAQWDTRTGLPVVGEWSDEWSARHGLALRRVPTPESYADIVTGKTEGKKGGFAGGFPGEGAHGFYQNRLKDRARVAFQRQIRASGELPKGAPILYVSGIRAAESARRRRLLRAGPLEVRYRNKTTGGRLVREKRPRREVHVSPLLFLTDEGKARQFAARGWQPNPAAQALGISAECMCLCNGDAAEEKAARAFDPAWGEGRAELEAAVRDAGYPWGPGESPPSGWLGTDRGRPPASELAKAELAAPTLFDAPVPMCAGACTRKLAMKKAAA